MRTIFLDTVGLLAVWDVADQWHVLAEPVYEQLNATNVRLVTTSLVLYECGNAASRRPYRNELILLRENLNIAGDLLDPTLLEIDSAWETYARGQAGDAGIVDLVSFSVMRRLGITQVFTNDAHFTAAGFEVLF